MNDLYKYLRSTPPIFQESESVYVRTELIKDLCSWENACIMNLTRNKRLKENRTQMNEIVFGAEVYSVSGSFPVGFLWAPRQRLTLISYKRVHRAIKPSGLDILLLSQNHNRLMFVTILIPKRKSCLKPWTWHLFSKINMQISVWRQRVLNPERNNFERRCSLDKLLPPCSN